jgi:hypothetical protein
VELKGCRGLETSPLFADTFTRATNFRKLEILTSEPFLLCFQWFAG